MVKKHGARDRGEAERTGYMDPNTQTDRETWTKRLMLIVDKRDLSLQLKLIFLLGNNETNTVSIQNVCLRPQHKVQDVCCISQ